jgi:hypothetical protein
MMMVMVMMIKIIGHESKRGIFLEVSMGLEGIEDIEDRADEIKIRKKRNIRKQGNVTP